ncbi:SPP1 phage holin [Eubacterium aggregans]|uniref:SPP1 phage holin n=1 Tax=Eubacterium aggregans TaxID=81409 RepID=A0A1H3XD30_9FIRM|nr:phage holin [Eubacterium aggregans]SDZ97306.1 SPP1 phage holin [Eubacterium aggregans]
MNAKNYITLALLALSTANGILTALGYSILPITDEQLTVVVTSIIQVISIAAAIWQNFNFSVAAKQGQAVTDAIKAGKDVDVMITSAKASAMASENEEAASAAARKRG